VKNGNREMLDLETTRHAAFFPHFSFIPNISIAPLQVHYYSEALPTTALILCWS